MISDFSKDLVIYIKAGYPILNVLSSEEDRVLERVDELRRDTTRWQEPRELFIWTISRGWLTPNGQPAAKEDTRDPVQALGFVRKHERPALFLLKDFHPYLDERTPQVNASMTIRSVRDLVPHLAATGKTMLWVSPVLKIPPELEKDVTVVDLPLPTEAEYRAVLDGFIQKYGGSKRVIFNLDEEGKDLIVKACQGLTKCEAENALAKAIVGRGRLDAQDVRCILEEKEQIIRKSGILEFYSDNRTFADVGGLANLKAWLAQRNDGFSQKALDFGLSYPKGALLVGVPGCGKSLCAKAVAAAWQKPLLKFDLGRVYAKYVGEAEANMDKALRVAEEVAPSVLWIDELEKGLAGIGGGGDGGAASRVFGKLLTWMEEKKKPVFVVATANDITKLPPELLRKGRFDAIFFVDLPGPRERAEILMIHLARRGRDPNEFDLAALVQATDQFSGVEIEDVVVSGLNEAWADRRPDADPKLATRHLLKAASEVKPLAHTRQEDIARLRAWAAENCRMAARPPETEQDERPAPESLVEKQARRLDLGGPPVDEDRQEGKEGK
jgi:ATP-dependent 26S proteasome regulatory subunit